LAFGGISIAVFLAAAGWLFYRQTMHPSHGALLSSRDELWAPAWQGFVSSPLIGQGAHTYASLFLQTHSTPPARLFDYAHSIYLDVLSSSGLLGLAAFLWLIAGLGRIFLRRLREAEENDLPVVLGASAVLAGFLVHGLADSVHHTVPTCLWMLSIILGASLSPGEPTGKTAGLSKWSARALPLLVAAYAWFNLWQAMPLAQGVQAAQPGDYSRAAVLLRDAARRDPNLAVPHQQQGLVEAHLAAAGDPAALDRAIAAFERAAELDPYWGLNSANLGLLYLQAGDQDAAVRAFQQAIMAAPESGQYHLLAGAAYEASGHTDSAMEAYNQALDLQPRLHEAIFWQVTAQRRQVLAGWQSADSGESPTLARLEAALRSDPSDLRAYLPLISAHLNAGRLEEADRLASQAGFAYSIRAEDRLTLLNLRADLADAQHDGQTAAILRAQAELQFGEPGLYGPGDMVQSWYAQWSYRRMALNLDWVPQAKSYVE
jgi:tetratricopeptide (TPR) repeat protein